MQSIDARVYFVLQLEKRIGELYAWGGDGPDEFGADCSGVVCDALSDTARVAPGLYDGARRSAQGILAYYRKYGVRVSSDMEGILPGCLVFFHSAINGRVFHVQAHSYYFDTMRAKHALSEDMVEMWHGPRGVHATSRGGHASALDEPGDALARGAGVFPCQTGTHGGHDRISVVDPFSVLVSQ